MTKTALATPEEPERRLRLVPEPAASSPATESHISSDGRGVRRSGGRKRANGEGTIVQRKDGRYEAKVFVLTSWGMPSTNWCVAEDALSL
jgi:hypothetical protein